MKPTVSGLLAVCDYGECEEESSTLTALCEGHRETLIDYGANAVPDKKCEFLRGIERAIEVTEAAEKCSYPVHRVLSNLRFLRVSVAKAGRSF